MKLLHVTPQILPFTNRSDPGSCWYDPGAMARALPAALSDMGHDVTVISAVDAELAAASTVARRVTPVCATVKGEELEIEVLEAGLHHSHARLLLLALPPRPITELDEELVPTPSALEEQSKWAAVLCSATAQLVGRLGLNPDVVHLHAEAASLLPCWDQLLAPPPPVFALTFYDPQREGSFPLQPFTAMLGISTPSAKDNAAEASAGSAPTAAQNAIERAKAVTLPSNGARRQLMFSRRRLCLKSALESHGNVVGIMGAADEGRWNPATDPNLAARFTHDELSGKSACKRALQERAGLAPRNDAPLAVACPGLLPDDGAEQLADAAQAILAQDVQLALLGSGPSEVASRFNSLARDQDQRMAVLDQDAVPPQVALAGADLVLAPANWAPWGRLVQAGQKYGAVPVVHATGGLDDLVVDWDPRTRTGGGFKYRRPSADDLLAAITRAKEMFDHDDPELWSTLCRNNMVRGYTWKDAARRCNELYSGIVEKKS